MRNGSYHQRSGPCCLREQGWPQSPRLALVGRRHGREPRRVARTRTSARSRRPARQPLQRHALRRRFLTVCKVPGRERLRTLTIHHGRYTFVSHALAGGRTLAEVRDAAGHSSVLLTSIYPHVAVEDEGEVGRLFGVG